MQPFLRTKKKLNKSKKMVYYAVFKGKTPGVYTNWEETKKQVIGFPKAKYKKFDSRHEAENFAAYGGINVVSVNGMLMTTSSQKEVDKHFSKKRKREELESQIPYPKTTPIFISSISSVHSTTSLQSIPKQQQSVQNENPFMSAPKEEDSSSIFRIFTDGSLMTKPNCKEGAAGYGVYFQQIPSQSLSVAAHEMENNDWKIETTSQRMELYAILFAFVWIEKNPDLIKDKEVIIYTDSNYSYRCFCKDQWVKMWKANGWWTRKGEKVKNQDIIEKIDSYTQIYPSVKIKKIPAHVGYMGNEMADKLAKQGANRHFEYLKSIHKNSFL